MKRDWLFRLICPLCSRSVDSDKVLVLGHHDALKRNHFAWPHSQQEKDEISSDLCWGCIIRCDSWMRRHGRNDSLAYGGSIRIREEDILEFTAHIMVSKPAWFQTGKPEWNAPITFTAKGVEKCLLRHHARHPDSAKLSLENLMQSVRVREALNVQVPQQS